MEYPHNSLASIHFKGQWSMKLIFKASLDKKWAMEMYKDEGNNHVAK
jgi:hypothetical protein